MLLSDYIPSQQVSELVHCYRIVHLKFDQSENIPFKAYPPKPEQCLHFFLRDFFAIQKPGSEKEVQPAVILAGQRTALVNQYTGCDFLDVQIVFQPTAVFQLTGIPAYELANHHVDATNIFSKDLRIVLEQLQSATDYSDLIHIIESFSKWLICLAHKEPIPLDVVSKQMKLNNLHCSIESLAKQSCLCSKQFKRKFYERVGVNPKTYARIIRFNRAFNFKNRFPYKGWSSIATTCGYHDYQHLVKDYKDFTGVSPAEFHLIESKAPENILGLAKSLYHSRCQIGYYNE